MKKIAIIDHVGMKAGMDYYSSSLAKGFLANQCSCVVSITFFKKNNFRRFNDKNFNY